MRHACAAFSSTHSRRGGVNGRGGGRRREGGRYGASTGAYQVSTRRGRSRVQRVRSSQVDETKGTETVTSPSSVKREIVCACGRCDGSGRIIGGIGAVPGFRWWPIKAYRPCPGLIESGRGYERCVDKNERRRTQSTVLHSFS